MNSSQSPTEILGKREWDALELIARGCKDRQITQALEIEERMVRLHVENILDKLKASNKTEAVCHAFRNAWIRE